VRTCVLGSACFCSSAERMMEEIFMCCSRHQTATGVEWSGVDNPKLATSRLELENDLQIVLYRIDCIVLDEGLAEFKLVFVADHTHA